MTYWWRSVVGACGLLLAGCGSGAVGNASPSEAPSGSFLAQFAHMTQIASTVPSNGDLNPYGVAVVPASSGRLVAGDILVSNFNNRGNVQGTGTTIVEISPAGQSQLFAHVSELPADEPCPGGIGLTVALAILPGDFVLVGSLPTEGGGNLPARDPAGCLLVLSDNGSPVETLTDKNLDAPWDLALTSTRNSATVFVSDALGAEVNVPLGGGAGESVGDDSGDANVVRLDLALSGTAPPVLVKTTVIGSGFPWSANRVALDLAPTGLALSHDGTLYVDDADTNSVYAIPDAVTRSSAFPAARAVISSGGDLNQPLGMALAPTGDLVIMNGNDGDAVELAASGRQVGSRTIIKNGAGDLIGLTIVPSTHAILFGDDADNALDLLSS